MTRALRTSMRGTSTLENVDEVIGNSGSHRRPVEAFVPWKKPSVTKRQGGSGSPAHCVSNVRGNFLKEKPTHGRSCTPQSSPNSVSRPLPSIQESANEMARSAGRQKRQSGPSLHTSSAGGPKSNESPQGGTIVNTVLSRTATSLGGRERTPVIQSSPNSFSTKSTQPLQEEIFICNRQRRFSLLQGVQGKEGQLTTKNPSLHGSSVLGTGRIASCAGSGFSDEKEHATEFGKSPAFQDKDEGFEDHDEEYGDDLVRSSRLELQSMPQRLGLYRDGDIQTSVNEEDNNAEAVDLVENIVGDEADYDRDVDDQLYPTEAKRKKERRQERAVLEKEGERRRKEGLPRNFLLVDERTGKPYGVGVGDWRKELMLLSRDLDPAIGNINKQPEAAVNEIAEWIQQTWEYSCPVKFEYVKEVIARGVTLRRAELWKKIRNGEKKPSGMSDRTWRTLERQLDNPASIKKSEDCRRANASRVNFGRTGPLGEVGTRQRLRRILRRFPDPDEVRVEMARDKGYGGCHGKRESDLNVMHGSGRQERLMVDGVQTSAQTRNLEEDKNVEMDNKEVQENESDEVDVEDCAIVGSGEKATGKTIASMSIEHITQHPLVQMMMQRLKALEATRETDAMLEDHCVTTGEVVVGQEKARRKRGDPIHHDVEVGGRTEDAEDIEGTPSSQRQLKKRKQG